MAATCARNRIAEMLNLHYFAGVRESLERDQEQVELPKGVRTVADLIAYLREADASFDRMINEQEQVLVAVNQAVAGQDRTIRDEDEIAFFPPMSGG